MVEFQGLCAQACYFIVSWSSPIGEESW